MESQLEGELILLGVFLYFVASFAIITGVVKAAKKHGCVSLPAPVTGPLSFLATPACLIMWFVGVQTHSMAWALVTAVIGAIATGIGAYYLFDKTWAKT
jgi:hypothetical protein